MPDSPKCPNCSNQTFKIAGKPAFKCGSCKRIYAREAFKQEDFEWRNNGTN